MRIDLNIGKIKNKENENRFEHWKNKEQRKL